MLRYLTNINYDIDTDQCWNDIHLRWFRLAEPALGYGERED